MTTTMPPHTPGWSRRVPVSPNPDTAHLLRGLLLQKDAWVLRPSWAKYLRTGDRDCLVAIDWLSRDHLVAIHAWLRQQRHALHRAIEGGAIAPDGWIEATPLYDYVRSEARLDY